MISSYGLPSLFITLTMAKSHWKHLHKILKATDNQNTIPTNRPVHTTLHFIHRFQQLKKYILKNQNLFLYLNGSIQRGSP